MVYLYNGIIFDGGKRQESNPLFRIIPSEFAKISSKFLAESTLSIIEISLRVAIDFFIYSISFLPITFIAIALQALDSIVALITSMSLAERKGKYYLIPLK